MADQEIASNCSALFTPAENVFALWKSYTDILLGKLSKEPQKKKKCNKSKLC